MNTLKNSKKIKKSISFFLAVVTLISIFTLPAFAEGNVETILTSNISSVPTQGNVNISIKLNVSDPNGLGAIDNLQLNYDPNAFDYFSNEMPNRNLKVTPSTGNVKINYNTNRTDLDIFTDTITLQFTFRAKASAKMGAYKFSVSGYNFYSNVKGEFFRTDVKIATDLSINVAEGKSNNNKLKSLSVKDYKISPEFSSDVFEYSLGVPTGTKSVDITAIADDANATVVIAGNTNLAKDINPISVIVTASDGSTQIYKITAKLGVSTEQAAQDTEGSLDDKAKIEALELKLKETNLRNLIIVLILIFIIVCLIVYLLIEKYGDKWFNHGPKSKKKGDPDDEDFYDEDEEDEDYDYDDEEDEDIKIK
ncbi:MAG: cadherin-like beta sandwich domain-containing protein [Clostridia bacterium]